MVFRGIPIPRGSHINSASLILTSIATLGTTVCNTRIYGEANSNPVYFSTYADFIGRSLTTAHVDWSNLLIDYRFKLFSSGHIINYSGNSK